MSWNSWSLDKVLNKREPECIGKYSKKKPSCQGCESKPKCREMSR